MFDVGSGVCCLIWMVPSELSPYGALWQVADGRSEDIVMAVLALASPSPRLNNRATDCEVSNCIAGSWRSAGSLLAFAVIANRTDVKACHVCRRAPDFGRVLCGRHRCITASRPHGPCTRKRGRSKFVYYAAKPPQFPHYRGPPNISRAGQALFGAPFLDAKQNYVSDVVSLTSSLLLSHPSYRPKVSCPSVTPSPVPGKQSSAVVLIGPASEEPGR